MLRLMLVGGAPQGARLQGSRRIHFDCRRPETTEILCPRQRNRQPASLANRIEQLHSPMSCHCDLVRTHAKRWLPDYRPNDSVGLAIECCTAWRLNLFTGLMSGQPVECRRPAEGSIHAKQRAIVSNPIGNHGHDVFRSASRFNNGQTPVNDLASSQSHASQSGRAIDSDDLQVEVNQTARDFITASRASR